MIHTGGVPVLSFTLHIWQVSLPLQRLHVTLTMKTILPAIYRDFREILYNLHTSELRIKIFFLRRIQHGECQTLTDTLTLKQTLKDTLTLKQTLTETLTLKQTLPDTLTLKQTLTDILTLK
jgi:hypothetical protein